MTGDLFGVGLLRFDGRAGCRRTHPVRPQFVAHDDAAVVAPKDPREEVLGMSGRLQHHAIAAGEQSRREHQRQGEQREAARDTAGQH